jgi:hypothetical protein
VHCKDIPVYIQQDATLHSLFISGITLEELDKEGRKEGEGYENTKAIMGRK